MAEVVVMATGVADSLTCWSTMIGLVMSLVVLGRLELPPLPLLLPFVSIEAAPELVLVDQGTSEIYFVRKIVLSVISLECCFFKVLFI